MTTLTAPLQSAGAAGGPLRTGITLAITVAVFYALCTLAWLAAPGPFLGFMNNLFHGIDFGPLLKPAPFYWGGFIEALMVMSVWAFLAGTFFAWVHRRLAR